MRILQLAQLYPPVIGGEERHVRNLSVALAARGHEVHVGCFDVGEVPQDDPGVTVHPLPHIGARLPALYPTSDRPLSPPVPDPVVTRALGRLVDRVRPDVVHAHNWIVNSYLPLAAARRTPLVLSLHDYSHVCATKRLMYRDELCSGPGLRKCFDCSTDWYGAGRGPVIAGLVRAGRPARDRWVDVFTPVSSYVGRANQLSAQGVRWEVVPNFVPDSLLGSADVARDPALPEDDFLFFAGDLSEQKGLATLLAAYESLDPTTRPALVTVGGRRTMDLSVVPDGVTVGDGWAHDRVVSAFRHCVAAVLPSVWPDPCPTTVLEAMAIGAPLVTTSMGGIADMVADDDSALVVRPRDVPGTAAAIQRLLDDPALRARLADRARVQVGGFLQSAVAAQLEGIYTSLV